MFQNEQRITITARDLKVVSALQCDGRMTMQALADKIGISVYAATESYRRLTESGIMSIVPVCNPLSLGNYSQVLVGLRLDGSRDEALAMLQSMPQVTYVVCALGDADIIAEAVVYSAEGMDLSANRSERVAGIVPSAGVLMRTGWCLMTTMSAW